MARRYAVLMLGLAVNPFVPRLAAQRAAVASPVFKSLNPGDLLRVAVSGGPRLTGRYVGISGDTIRLRTDSTVLSVRTIAIDSLWTRHRPIVLRGLRGMEIGAALGVVLIATRAISKTADCVNYGWLKQGPDPHCEAQPGYAVRTITLTTVVGAVVGVVAGVAFPEWKR